MRRGRRSLCSAAAHHPFSMESRIPKLPVETHLVDSIESPKFVLMEACLRHSTVVGLDAEWKPSRRLLQQQQHNVCGGSGGDGGYGCPDDPSSSSRGFPTVTVLQIACRYRSESSDWEGCVFVVDLVSVPVAAIWEILREVFVAPDVIKLGFRFKQDLLYLSSTFSSQGCHPGFDKVVPFFDITGIYHHLKTNYSMQKIPKENKSFATICKELLGISLSKELQCSDWSHRPLTVAQISYAAADAYYLLEIFDVFRCNFVSKGTLVSNITECYAPSTNLGLKELFEKPDACDNVLRIKCCKASDMVKSSGLEILSMNNSCRNAHPIDDPLSKIVRIYGERIFLRESDIIPRTSKRKGRRRPLFGSKDQKQNGVTGDWEGPPPWDQLLGGDGYPKFLCDVMVEGLAKHLRCVGIDAATPSSRKPEPRLLINQAHKEKRVLLTRDAKLLKHQYLIRNQVYKVKSLLKNDQLMEVVETFQLKICEEQLMSRCTKCNGRFIQKPLTNEEAVKASRGFQRIPDCLFSKDLEFWQCTDCNQLYWEGTQYHNAVQKFINVCKLNE